MKTSTKFLLIKLLPILIGIIILYFLLKRLGLIKPLLKSAKEKIKEKQKEETQELREVETLFTRDEYFDPNSWTKAVNSKLISDDLARLYAQQINDAWGFWSNHDEEINAIFRNLTSKYQISQIAFFYYNQYKRDLATDLIEKLRKSELKVLYKIIDEI